MFGFHSEMKKASPAAPVARGFKARNGDRAGAEGAALAQAMNQQPDSIPAMVKPGEFVLPPDTVHAMGGPEVLQGIVDATHTPAPDVAVVPKGFQPKAFFAQGGGVPQDDYLANTYQQLNQQRAASAAAARAAAQRDGEEAAQGAAPAPNSPSNTFPGNRLQGNSGFSGAPAGQKAAPVAAVEPAPVRTPGPSELYMKDRAQEMRDQWGQGQYAQAAGTAARTAVQGLGMYGLEAADKVATPVINAARGFGRGLFGSDANAAPAPAASTPAATPAAKPATAATNPTDTRLAAGTQTAPASTPNPAPAQTPDASAGKQVMPGVYSHGPGQYSDQPGSMGMPAGFTGQPSAQNNAAAENLARGFRPGAADVAQSQPASVQAPTVLHSGNSWQARNDLRNAEVSASSIMNRKEWNRAGVADAEGKIAGFRAAQEADAKLRGAQADANTAAMRENADLTREGMQQAGANQRAGMGFQTEQQRLGLDAQRAAGEAEVRGFKVREAKQMENLRATLLDPKATPEQKRQAREALQAIMGKVEENRFTVVPGGQEWVAQAGAMRNVPARVLNNQTGQFVEQPAQMTQQAQFEKGRIYTDAAGRRARYNGSGWEPV